MYFFPVWDENFFSPEKVVVIDDATHTFQKKFSLQLLFVVETTLSCDKKKLEQGVNSRE